MHDGIVYNSRLQIGEIAFSADLTFVSTLPQIVDNQTRLLRLLECWNPTYKDKQSQCDNEGGKIQIGSFMWKVYSAR